jgi:hypothetical protein
VRWKRIGLYFLAGVVTTLITVVALLISVDLGIFKDRVESLVTDVLGREFRIDGELHVNLGTSVDLYAEEVYLANPDWAEEAAFVTVRKIDIAVNTWSLLSGPIDIERLEIDGVRVNIETNQDGDASWTFEGLKSGADDQQDEEAGTGRLPIILDYAAINDAQVSYLSPAMAEPLLFIAESLISSIVDDELKTELTGSLNGTPLHLIEKSGPIDNLLGYKNVSSTLEGNIGEITITGSAWIDDLLRPRRPRLRIDMEGPSASYLTGIFSDKPVTTGALGLSVSIEESGESMVASIAGVFGEFNIEVNGRFRDIQELHDIDLDFAADGPDIGAIIRMAGREYAEVDPFELRGKIGRSGSEVTIEDVSIIIGASQMKLGGFFGEFPKANGAHFSLLASGPDYGRFNKLFGLPGRLGGVFETSLTLEPQDDGRTLIELDIDSEHAKINLYSLLSRNEKFVDSTVRFSVAGPDIEIVATAAGLAGLPAEAFEITGAIDKDGSGFLVNNVRALVGDDTFRVDGHIGDNPLTGETNLEIDFSGSDFGASLGALAGSSENLPKGEYHLRGRVQHQDDRLWLRDIEAAIGDNEEYKFQISGYLTTGQQLVDSQVTVNARGASVAALGELLGLQGIPDFPFDVSADIRRGTSSTHFDKGVFKSGIVVVEFAGNIGDSPLEDDLALTFDASVPRMREVIGEFGVAIDNIPVGDLLASGVLQQKNGKLSLERFDATFSGVKLLLSGDIGKPLAFEDTRIRFEVSGDNLSRMLPPQYSRESLIHEFAASGRVSLRNGDMEVDRLKANIGHTSFGGNFTFDLDPLFDKGEFRIEADSPDLYQLLPALKEVGVPLVAKMKYRGSGHWERNFWSFDNSRLELGGGFISVNGSLDGPPNFDRTDMEVEWMASSVRNFSVIAGRELPDQQLHLKARLLGTSNEMTMEDFALTFGESDLGGQFVMRGGGKPFVRLDVRSRLFDISDYLPEPEQEPPAEAPDPERKVIADTPLPMQLLQSFEAVVNVRIDELRTRSLNVRDFEIDALVSEGAVKVENLSLASKRGGYLKLSADLTPVESGGAEFALDVDGKDLVMGFMAKTDEDLQALPLFELRAKLTANGETYRDMAGSIDGYIRFVGAAGRVRAGSLTMFTQDFVSEIIGAVNPFAKTDPYTNVECAVILLHFDDGVISGKPALVQQTDKLRIFANTTIDLKTEKLDADFKTVPRKGLGISFSSLVNPYIKLTGTLAKPSMILNPEGVLVEGGIAVATAGLSILAKSFKDRFLSDKDPCGTALSKADEKYLESLEAN